MNQRTYSAPKRVIQKLYSGWRHHAPSFSKPKCGNDGTHQWPVLPALVSIATFLIPTAAVADINVRIGEAGGSVVISYYGSLNTTGLVPSNSGPNTLDPLFIALSSPPFPELDSSRMIWSPPGGGNFAYGPAVRDQYFIPSGFPALGSPGFTANPDTTTGDVFGWSIQGLFLPLGYEDGAPLMGAATFENTSIAILLGNLTPTTSTLPNGERIIVDFDSPSLDAKGGLKSSLSSHRDRFRKKGKTTRRLIIAHFSSTNQGLDGSASSRMTLPKATKYRSKVLKWVGGSWTNVTAAMKAGQINSYGAGDIDRYRVKVRKKVRGRARAVTKLISGGDVCKVVVVFR